MHMPTFFWYDLETSGISARYDRIMQFAGQRTTIDLEVIGEPINVLVRLSDDILPEPDAVLVTGITPQQTLADGMSEADFLRMFREKVATPGTVFAGFNTVRFDDEFLRFAHYRNFYDPYEWQWKDGRGRWDLLDVVRMTRALRPEGINWPVLDGKPTNRLELLTKDNGIAHEGAHDALADVEASIAVARLIRDRQPRLFEWLLSHKDKASVRELVEVKQPFVYSSGKYDNVYEKTTVATWLADHPKQQGALVYDLRHDPTPFLSMSPGELVERWRYNRQPDAESRLPIKTLQYNRCPAIAPLGVLDDASQVRIGIELGVIAKRHLLIRSHDGFARNVLAALETMNAEQTSHRALDNDDVDQRLYDGFYDSHDKNLLAMVRAAEPNELVPELGDSFHDERLKSLLIRYKARNYPSSLTPEERATWEAYRHYALLEGGEKSRLSKFMHRLSQLAESSDHQDKRFLLEELQLYAESIIPLMDDGADSY